jgi:hypothetical protein
MNFTYEHVNIWKKLQPTYLKKKDLKLRCNPPVDVRPHTFKKAFNFPQINWTPKYNWCPFPTVGSAAWTTQNGRATVILKKKTFHLAKIMTVVHEFLHIYQPLNFQENMFVVHDFTYEPLNFRKNMFADVISKKKTSNFVIIHPKTPLSMNFYVWASKLLGEKICNP